MHIIIIIHNVCTQLYICTDKYSRGPATRLYCVIYKVDMLGRKDDDYGSSMRKISGVRASKKMEGRVNFRSVPGDLCVYNTYIYM